MFTSSLQFLISQRFLTLRYVFVVLLFVSLVGCQGREEVEDSSEETSNPRSHAKEVSEIWEVPKSKARNAKRSVEAADITVRDQIQSLE